jgi:two-component system phosphate regulon sensor histidine kinase PhoR
MPHRLWLALLAWLALAVAFGVAGHWTVGIAIAAVGFGFVAVVRTRTLIGLDGINAAIGDEIPKDEVLASVYNKINALRTANAAREKEQAAMRQSWDLLPASVVVLDFAHRIVWANASARENLGVDRDQHAGEPFSLHFRDLEVTKALQVGFPRSIELYSPVRPHRLLDVSGVRNGDAGWLLIAVDITDSRRIEHMRRDFVGNVAHELKTPLTVIAGFNETIANVGDLSAEERLQITRHIQTQTKSMQRLVEDLLSLSRLESTETLAALTPFSVLSCATRVVQSADLAARGRTKVSVTLPTEMHALGDESDFESALLNLVINALRYTPPDGAVSISHRVLPENSGIAIDVSDSGVGIAPEHLPRLAERFYRVDRGRSRQSGGTGLGLAIVKHVMIRHEGKLEIMSEVGKGSRFSLVLPNRRVTGV